MRSTASVADLAVCKAGAEFASGKLVIHKLGTIRRRVCLNRLLSGSLRHQFRRLALILCDACNLRRLGPYISGLQPGVTGLVGAVAGLSATCVSAEVVTGASARGADPRFMVKARNPKTTRQAATVASTGPQFDDLFEVRRRAR